jgi:hypothetical protein
MNVIHDEKGIAMREPEIYCIRVEGHLGDEWSEWLGGMVLTRLPDGTTTLTGSVEDQSALHGLLLKLHNMGVALIACDRVCDPTEDHASS